MVPTIGPEVAVQREIILQLGRAETGGWVVVAGVEEALRVLLVVLVVVVVLIQDLRVIYHLRMQEGRGVPILVVVVVQLMEQMVLMFRVQAVQGLW